MAFDSIIAEVRQTRDELAKRFNYDLRAIIQDARDRQAVGGRKVVTLQPACQENYPYSIAEPAGAGITAFRRMKTMPSAGWARTHIRLFLLGHCSY